MVPHFLFQTCSSPYLPIVSDLLLRPECRNPNSCPHPKSTSMSSQCCPECVGDPPCLHFRCFHPGVSAHPASPGPLWGLIIGLLTSLPSSLQSIPLTGSRRTESLSLPLLKHSSPSHTEDKSRHHPPTPVPAQGCVIQLCLLFRPYLVPLSHNPMRYSLVTLLSAV